MFSSLILLRSGINSRPSRPSPNAAPVEILATHEPQVTLSDTHYDRLEAILIEKIQTLVQSGEFLSFFIFNRHIVELNSLGMKSAFEPYRDLKDNLHKDLAAKLSATDSVIKQTITQTFRSKVIPSYLLKLWIIDGCF